MLENKIEQLTKSVDQLTVAIEALLEVHRASPAPGLETETKTVSTAETKTVDAPKRGRRAAAPVPQPEPASEPKVEEAPKTEEGAPPVEAPKSATLQDLRAAAQKALDNGKLNAVVALNKEYGLKRISDASEAQYPEILAKLEAINGEV